MEQHLACVSDTMWRNAMVLFTFGEELRGETIETHIETEGKALQWLVKKCDNRYHVFSDTPFNDFPQVKELLEGIDKMVEANTGQYFSNIISKIHRETYCSERWSDPLDGEDEDEYTPRERRMMEKMIKEMRELLLVDIKSYLSTHLKTARSIQFTNPTMSVDQPTSSEDGLMGRGKDTQQREDTSSGYSTQNWDMDRDDTRMMDLIEMIECK